MLKFMTLAPVGVNKEAIYTRLEVCTYVDFEFDLRTVIQAIYP